MDCKTPSTSADVKEATKALKEDKRRQLREIGRQKFEEFRSRRQSHGAASPALSQGKEITSSEVGGHVPGSAAATLHSPAVQQSPQRHTEGGEQDVDQDPLMISMLLQQVEELMQEKRVLSRDKEQLQRENQQLHELVGYLSYSSNEQMLE